jgi:Flp pilus assembly protein TadG
VELAVALPIIILVVLGSLEGANLMFAKQAMVESAYQAVKVAIRPETSNQLAIDAANEVATGRRLDSISVQFDPPNVATASPGTPIRVTVAVSADQVRILNSRLIPVADISAVAVMIKE